MFRSVNFIFHYGCLLFFPKSELNLLKKLNQKEDVFFLFKQPFGSNNVSHGIFCFALAANVL